MFKPTTQSGYNEQHTLDCERVLVTLLRGLGPWKESVYLIGGLVPRYLVAARPPKVPPHAGTQDVDVVIDLQLLAETEAYQSLENNLKKMGFERSENEHGKKLSWQWQTRTENDALIILELLADAPHIAGGKVQPLMTSRSISAINIPHSSMVFDMHDTIDIQVELLYGNGCAMETVRYSNLVCFTCLKLLAYDQRFERKDAHDLVYCIEHATGGYKFVIAAFCEALSGKHTKVVRRCIEILRNRFASDNKTEGYRKDGPVSVAKFEFGDDDNDTDMRNARLLRQRQASEVIDRLLTEIDGARDAV